MEVSNTNNYSTKYYGGFPSITFSGDMIHIACTDVNYQSPTYSMGIIWERIYHLGSSPFWEEPVVVGTPTNQDFSCVSKIIYAGGYTHIFYSKYFTDGGPYYSKIIHKQRLISDEHGWGNPDIVTGDYISDPTWSFDIKTCDSPTMDNSQIGITFIYCDLNYNVYVGYQTYDVTINTWSKALLNNNMFISNGALGTITPGTYLGINSLVDCSVCFGCSSYDRYFIWNPLIIQSNSLLYRQLDSPPKAPNNFTLTSSINSHPFLSWTFNNEPDVYSNNSNGYVLEKRTGSSLSPHNWGSWTMIPLSGTTNYYEDIQITTNSSDHHKMAEYRLRTYDNVYYSNYTNSLDISYGFVAEKAKGNNTNNKNLTTYDLLQNFPNPFNPTTQLSFSIPNPSFTQLKVYDVFGREITTLVNEFLQEGIYNYEFNGKKLASGVYFYTLKAGDYSSTKKMVLTK